MKRSLLSLAFAVAIFTAPALAQQATPAAKPTVREFTELKRFPAPEAHQGVAVDKQHFYPVTNFAIGKYDKNTGQLVGKFEMPKDGPIIHFDSGVVIDGKIYASHSNYPQEPMTSSVEIIDAATMKHIGTHSFGIMLGSCTWIDRHDGAWWAVFGNYSRVFGTNQRPYGNSYWTTLVKMDDKWKIEQAWIFPTEVIKRAEPMSISGGSWGPDGLLYVTGHDHTETYVLRLPKMGSILELVETVPLNVNGQGIAWDRSDPGTIWGISRAKKEVIVSRMRTK
ncbi:MAG: hypothetical protein ACRCV9_11215 [Burkholderiaceae bacterium]